MKYRNFRYFQFKYLSVHFANGCLGWLSNSVYRFLPKIMHCSLPVSRVRSINTSGINTKTKVHV